MPNSPPTPPISILPLTPDDILTCASLTARAFHSDRHTRVKQLGRKPFDLQAMFTAMLTASLTSERHLCVKAVAEDGEITGWCGWGWKGVDVQEIREVVDFSFAREARQGEEGSRKREEERKNDENEDEDDKDKDDEDTISRLHALEAANMQTWTARLMPPSCPPTRCLYITSLTVSPAHQRRGIGTALARWGANLADKLNVFVWVHASEEAWALLSGMRDGWEEVGRLVVDLDEYAPRGPDEGERKECGLEGGRGGWGEYVLRYVKRMPGGVVG